MRRRKSIDTTIDFKKSQLIDKKLIDKASLWILRIILNLGGHRELIDKDTVLAFLDGNQFLDTDEKKYTTRATNVT